MPKKNKNQIKSEQYKRSCSFRFKPVEDGVRTLPAAFSSEVTVKRWFGSERLLHTDKAINMQRAAEGLPLLFNHDTSKPIGRAENIQLVDGVLRGDVTFSENQLAEEVFKDVKGQFLRDISIGYQIEKYKDVAGGIEAQRWLPYEVSIVTVPADTSVGINRNHETSEEKIMGDENNENGNKTIVQEVGAQHKLGVQAGALQEQERANGIRALFSPHITVAQAPELMERCLSDCNVSIDGARTALLDLFSVGYKPTAAAGETRTEVGQEDSEKFGDAISDAICVRGGLEADQKVIDNVNSGEFRSYSLTAMARAMAEHNGMNIKGMDAKQLVGQSFIRSVGGHSTSDFPSILANVGNKAVAKGYALADTTWSKWAFSRPVSDFKTVDLVALSEFSNLEIKPEGGEFKYGTMTDKKEQLKVHTKAKGFSITREAIINDDLGMLTVAPQRMGQAAARSVEQLAYETLTSNPVLIEDGKTVFISDHKNIGSAGAIAEGTISELIQLMAMQQGILSNKSVAKNKRSTQLLNILAKYLIVPVSLKIEAERLMMAEFVSADLQPNMVRGALEVIASPYLDQVSSTAYYSLADQNVNDTVIMAFLNGKQTPTVESQNGWNVQGIDFHVYIDVGAAWGDFRGAAYNAGA